MYLSKYTGILDLLLKMAREDFAVAERVAGREKVILLKGVNSVVKCVEAKLDHAVVQMILELEKYDEKFTYPKHWESQESNCVLKEVKQGTEEWTQVAQHMKTAPMLQILHIVRIQNRWLWRAYEQSRQRVSKKNEGILNEKTLFHGTRNTPPNKIYDSEQGFDNRLSSRGLWGEGAYFAAKASYSNDYAFTAAERRRQIFMVKVITGITCKYMQNNRDLKAPPIIHDPSIDLMFEDQRYDSVCGNTNGSDVYVIYEHGRVYPEYLITYTYS